MFKRFQGLIVGVIIGSVATSGIVFAEQITKSINAVYMNVKLVVDGVQIDPKDGNGMSVEPFIYNGTTYLPVRAIGEALGKEVSWDGDTATVYVGGEVEKPAKEIYLFDKPYIDCDDAGCFSADKNKDKLSNFICLNVYPYRREDKTILDNERCSASNYVKYPLNGLAKKVKGTFIAPTDGNSIKPETQIKFYNENGKLLYQSPILNASTAPIDFEFDVTNCISLKVEGTATTTNNNYGGADCIINNFVVVTTDY